MTIEFNYKEAANLLKLFVNAQCEDGFKWYPEAKPIAELNIFSINAAIKLLENTQSEKMIVEE